MTNSIIKKAHITEKTALLSGMGKYVFLVDPSATKNEIKKALKSIYKVDIVDITTVTQQPLRRRFRGRLVLKQAPKKAVVTLKEGQKIDLT